jgi:hypothetical protein
LTADGHSLNPAKPVLRVVHGRTEICHGKNRIVVMAITLATEATLMSYMPDAKLLHTGEVI